MMQPSSDQVGARTLEFARTRRPAAVRKSVVEGGYYEGFSHGREAEAYPVPPKMKRGRAGREFVPASPGPWPT